MPEAQDGRPTVVVARRVKPGREDAFVAWAEGFTREVTSRPGCVSCQLVQPLGRAQPEWVFVSTVKPKEDYPFRVRVKPVIVLTPDQYLDVREIGPTLDYPKKWPPEHWRLAFQGNPERKGQALIVDKITVY